MPKTEIDYSNTVIYKITCKDPLITDLYVGHTTNFVQRKHGHKQGCINEKSSNYNCKLYKTIRANGGWDNWVMEIVAFFKCNDHYEARIKEQEYFTSLNATLNSLEPLPKPKFKQIEAPEPIVKTEHFFETCKVSLQNQELLDVHNQTQKHCKKVMGIEISKDYKFYCETCDYGCSKQFDYNKHLLTTKHKNRTLLNDLEQNVDKSSKKYTCSNCHKNYNARNSLWYHQKTCTVEEKSTNLVVKDDTTDKDQLILMLVNQNAELIKEITDFKSMMMKVIENGISINSHNTTTNSHNDAEKEDKNVKNVVVEK
jgi:hypothetical protein